MPTPSERTHGASAPRVRVATMFEALRREAVLTAHSLEYHPAMAKQVKKATKRSTTATGSTAKKKVTRAAPKKTTKKATTKKATAKKATAKKKPVAEIDLDEELSVEKLFERGRELDAERAARAAEESGKPRSVRAPVPARPSYPVHWGYPFSFDKALPPREYGLLNDFFETYTTISSSRGGFQIVAPETDPEIRRAAWDSSGTVLELEQLLAQLPSDDVDERSERLVRALARPTGEAWWEVAMLLSTWDRATLPAAIELAERHLERWPDELRGMIDAWKQRPELVRLVRVHWGELTDREIPDHITVVHTQDLAGLEAHQRRLARIKVLNVSGKPGIPRLLARLSGLQGLERLVLQHPTYSEKGTAAGDLAELLRAPHLQRLTGLSLYGYTLTKGDLEALATCEQPLEHLKIQYAKMQPDAAHALAALASRKRLRTLDLKYNDLGPKGARTLFAEPSAWQSLRVLDISANEIGDKGVQALAAAAPGELRWLNVSSNDQKNQLTAAAARALADAPGLANLETINVFGHPLGAEGVAALIHSPHLRALRGLNVAFAGASLADLAAHCGDDPVPLTELNLGHLPASGKQKRDLRACTFLRTVKMLNVESLDGADYKMLLACPHLGALEVLSLGGCYSNEKAALASLVAAEPPPNLRYLNLSGWKFTADTAARLADSPIGRQLWGLTLMTSYTPPEAWRAFYDAGLPLVGSPLFDVNAPSEYVTSTTFREEI